MKAVILLTLVSVVLVNARPKSADTVLSYLDTKPPHASVSRGVGPYKFADVISHESVLGENGEMASEMMYGLNEEEGCIVEYVSFEDGEYTSSEEFGFELEWTSFEINEDGRSRF